MNPKLSIRLDKETCRVYEKTEISITGVHADTVIEQVTYKVLPSAGKAFAGDGFPYAECFLDEKTGKVVRTSSDRCWKIRYAPLEEGDNQIKVVVKLRGGDLQSFDLRLHVSGFAGPGYIRTSDDHQYFQFSNGESYFAVGLNTINLQSNFLKLGEYFKRLAECGCNHIRLWLSASEVPLFSRKDGSVCDEHAWGYDYLLQIAEQHGIYLKLCFEHMRKFVDVEKEIWSDFESAFSRGKGGPCESELDFFANREARDIYKRKVADYIIARWGYSTNVFAWELWNEIDTVRGAGVDFQSRMWQSIVDWTQDIGSHIKEQDAGRHMVVNSTGSYVVRKELWDLNVMDFVQVHGYWKPDNFTADAYKDMAVFIEDYLGQLRPFNKPRLFAEFGLVNDRWGPNDLQYADRKGIVIHDGAWCAMACGAAGTGMFWWANQLEQMKLEWVYKGISSFVKDVDFADEHYQDAYAVANLPEVTVKGQRGANTTLLWVKNKASTWWGSLITSAIPRIKKVSVEVYDLAEGRYLIQEWDTVEGVVVREYETGCDGSPLLIQLEEINHDRALKLMKLRS